MFSKNGSTRIIINMRTIVSILFIIISSLFVYHLTLLSKKHSNCRTIYILENENYDLDDEYSQLNP